MSLEIYINEKQIQLSDTSRVGITFQAFDINSLTEISSNFSNQFKIAKTAENSAAVGYYDNINSGDFQAYENLEAKIVQDGIEIIPEGVAQCQDSDVNFNMTVRDGNKSFFDIIAGIKLTDLNLSAFNHTYDLATVNASVTNLGGYIYTKVNWWKSGSLSQGKYPFVFIKTLIQALADFTGYAIQGTFLTDYYYLNTLLSTVLRRGQAFILANSANTTYTTDGYVGEMDALLSTASPSVSIEGFHFPNNGLFVGQIYTVAQDSYMSFKATINMMFGDPSVSPSLNSFCDVFKIEIVNITTSTVVALDTCSVNATLTGYPRQATLTADTGMIAVTAGDQWQVRGVTETSAIGHYYQKPLFGSQFLITAGSQYKPYSGSVLFSGIQHDMLCRDFLKGIFDMFGIIPQCDNLRKILTLNKLNDVDNNKPFAKDWSNKIDLSQPAQVSTRNTNFAQKNYFKYQIDQDIKDFYLKYPTIFSVRYGSTDPAFYGSGVMPINDQTLDPIKDIIVLPFAASYATTLPVVNSDYTIDTFTPRVFILDRRPGYPVTDYAAFESDSSSLGGIKPPSLSFTPETTPASTSLMDNYAVLQNIFDRYKNIKPAFRINAIDVSELDHTVPVYLDVHDKNCQANGYFYLNKIDTFTGDKPCKCELIKI